MSLYSLGKLQSRLSPGLTTYLFARGIPPAIPSSSVCYRLSPQHTSCGQQPAGPALRGPRMLYSFSAFLICVIVVKYLISQFRSAHRIERGEAATRVDLTMAIADFPEACFDTAPPPLQSSCVWVSSNHWTSARRIISGRVGRSSSARRRSSIISINSRGSRSVRASVSFLGGAINNTILMLTS